MNKKPLEVKDQEEHEDDDSRRLASSIVTESFLELLQLLEHYAPVWYTEEQHNRAMTAVRVLKKT